MRYHEELKIKAELGNPTAQVNFGLWLACGDSIEDKEQAFYWFKKAADSGDSCAQYTLGNAYGEGIGVTIDMDEAEKWWRLSEDPEFLKRRRRFKMPIVGLVA